MSTIGQAARWPSPFFPVGCLALPLRPTRCVAYCGPHRIGYFPIAANSIEISNTNKSCRFSVKLKADGREREQRGFRR